MYKRIMVPVDGSEGAQRALDEATRLAQILRAEVQAVYVVELASRHVDASRPFVEESPADIMAREAATKTLDVARETLARSGVQGGVRAIDSYGDDLAAVLTRAVYEFPADLVVMYTHGHTGIKRHLAGSVTESLLLDTDVPLLLLRNESETQPG
jgi:nucleotide-binding universal stress UspA family protein